MLDNIITYIYCIVPYFIVLDSVAPYPPVLYLISARCTVPCSLCLSSLYWYRVLYRTCVVPHCIETLGPSAVHYTLSSYTVPFYTVFCTVPFTLYLPSGVAYYCTSLFRDILHCTVQYHTLRNYYGSCNLLYPAALHFHSRTSSCCTIVTVRASSGTVPNTLSHTYCSLYHVPLSGTMSLCIPSV